MYLFLSLVLAIISLYYINEIVDTYNSDTTFLLPLTILFMYSVLNIVRTLRGSLYSWLIGDDPYESDHVCGGYNRGSNTYNNPYSRSSNNYSYYNESTSGYSERWEPKVQTEKTEYFAENKVKEKDYEKELVHYPTKEEVRNKIKELEKNRWFRIKKNVGSIFGFDATKKYKDMFSAPIKTTVKCKVVNKEDHSRFAPQGVWQANKGPDEYNKIVKNMGRSCEISFAEITQEEMQ